MLVVGFLPRMIERIDNHRAIPSKQTERGLLITGNYALAIYEQKMEDESCFESRNKRCDGEKKGGKRGQKKKMGKKTAEMEGRKAPGVYTEGLAKKSIESRNRGKTRASLASSRRFAVSSSFSIPL